MTWTPPFSILIGVRERVAALVETIIEFVQVSVSSASVELQLTIITEEPAQALLEDILADATKASAALQTP